LNSDFPKDAGDFWNGLYREEGYRYGTEPNAFLVEATAPATGDSPHQALCVGAGEGRNAVWLAGQGYDVTALDISEAGLAKAEAMAAKAGVSIRTVAADFADFDFGNDRWDLIAAIFAHQPAPMSDRLHRRFLRALAPGGRLILEAYTPRQLEYGTGGPGRTAFLIEPEILREQLEGLRIDLLEETVRDIREGTGHRGKGAVVRCVAVKPA
jgi:SAM-dependent methyltransferase